MDVTRIAWGFNLIIRSKQVLGTTKSIRWLQFGGLNMNQELDTKLIQKRTFLFTNILQSVALGSKIQGASWKNLLKSAKGSSLPNIFLKRSWHQGNPANEAAQHGISQQYHGDIISYDAMFPYNFPCSKGGTLLDFTGYLWCTVIWVKACKGNRIKICLEIDPPTHRTSAHSMLVPEPSSPFKSPSYRPKKKGNKLPWDVHHKLWGGLYFRTAALTDINRPCVMASLGSLNPEPKFLVIPGWMTSDCIGWESHVFGRKTRDFLQLLPIVPINVDQVRALEEILVSTTKWPILDTLHHF